MTLLDTGCMHARGMMTTPDVVNNHWRLVDSKTGNLRVA